MTRTSSAGVCANSSRPSGNYDGLRGDDERDQEKHLEKGSFDDVKKHLHDAVCRFFSPCTTVDEIRARLLGTEVGV